MGNMVLPTFVQLIEEKPSLIFHIDLPRDLDELLVWIYLVSRSGKFPIELRLLGDRMVFTTVDEMLGFARGMKRTSDVFRVATVAN